MLRGIRRVIQCARERYDTETCDRMQHTLNPQVDQASVELHTKCYCSFTSKDHVSKRVTKKRKDDSIDSDTSCQNKKITGE